ncbi:MULTISPECIES: type II toxin-antitoxin system VapB family antitoxin [Sphingomonas]|uniref:PSK operon transcription factor n=1 Tax=Sphingomonas adhaesiva TaxID=28212 RepID=A0A2A4I6L8_9SPHN|nr:MULTISPECIES: type II toxin-antitoxin system VapB family antitoxin [Sphingomonas]PCG14139.1 PSK operon transcription factor [Sphingomonas adhaesiva]PZU81119.1 MAG: PSK operon transcription factor [Sphingomonas sp.]
MGISIKHEEIERAIRRLASERGLSLTDAIGLAVRHELERSEERPPLRERIRRIQERVATYDLDPRTPDEIIGYDEHGLPR